MTIASIWEFISQQGIQNKLSCKHAKSIILTNQISITAAISIIPLTILYYASSLTLLFAIEYVTFLMLVSCIGLNFLGSYQWWFYRLAKVTLFLGITLNIFLTSSILGYGSGFHLLYYAVLLGVMLFYNLHKRMVFLLLGLTIPIAYLITLELTSYSLLTIYPLSESFLHFFYLGSLCISITLSLLFAAYFNKLVNAAQQTTTTTQHKLEAIFENSYDAIAMVDPRTTLIQDCNQKAVELFEFGSKQAMIGKSSTLFQKTPFTAEETQHMLRLLYQSGRWVQERELLTQTGKSFWGDIGITLLEGMPTTMYLIRITDSTLKRVNSDQLRKNEMALRDAQRLAHIGSFEFSLHTSVGEVSEEIYRIFGLDPQDFFSLSSFLQTLQPGYETLFKEKLEQATPDFDTFKMECRATQPASGQVIYLQILGKVLFDCKQNPQTLVGTLQDITERKVREIELIKAKSQAEQASIAKEQFLATMSHEIRTPINAILGMSHYMLQDTPKPEQIENLQILQAAAENLLLLVNDILDLNKIEAGRIILEEIEFNFREIIQQFQQSYYHALAEKNLQWICTIDPAIPPTVCGDPVRLAQILNNLISNAVKFTKKGWIKLEITLSRDERTHVAINFSIEDSGIGITKEKLDVIFDSFTQVNSENTRKYGGTGLGLTITKRLLELYNSIIYVRSEVGTGSSFYFTIPFKKVRTQAPHPLTKTQGYILNKPPLNGVSILIVEDNEINRMVAAKFLERWDITHEFVTNGRDAIFKIKANHYDLVLMDLQMPELDGYQTTRLIREYSPIPVLAMTSTPIDEIKDKIAEVGMCGYVHKPFLPDDLYDKITQFVITPTLPEVPVTEPAVSTTSTPFALFKPTIDYRRILELTEGNEEFRQLLTQSYIKLFRQLKSDYENALLTNDVVQLRFIINYIEPPFSFLEVTGVKEEAMLGLKIAEKPVNDMKIVTRSVERMHYYCNQIIQKLEEKLLLPRFM